MSKICGKSSRNMRLVAITATAMLLAVISVAAFEENSSDAAFTQLGTFTDNPLTYYYGTNDGVKEARVKATTPIKAETNVVINDKITVSGIDYPVKRVMLSGFINSTGIRNMTLPESLEMIENNAFSGCTSMTVISPATTIPSKLTHISSGTFKNCYNLQKDGNTVVMPAGVTGINDSAFYGCKNITNITFNEGLISIGDFAFYGCTNMVVESPSITFPTSLKSLGNSTFYDCSKLQKDGNTVVIPFSNDASIYPNTFDGCSNITNITFNDNFINKVSTAGLVGKTNNDGTTTYTPPSAGYHAVYVSSGTNGTVAPLGSTSVADGSSLTITLTPKPGYGVNIFTVNGSAKTVSGNEYELSNITENIAVNVTFILLREITVTCTNCTSDPAAGHVMVKNGSNKTITFTPFAGYEVNTVEVNGSSGSLTSGAYTFTNVWSNKTITVACTPITYTFTLNPATGVSGYQYSLDGGVSWTDYTAPSNYDVTQNVQIRAVMDTGYTFSSWDGSLTNNPLNLTTGIINYTPVCAKTQYAITWPAESGFAFDSKSPAGPTVEHGTDVTFRISPAGGYSVDAVTCNGVDITPDSTGLYTVPSVTGPVSIAVAASVIPSGGGYVPPEPIVPKSTITVIVPSTGGISPSGTFSVNTGEDVTFTITQKDGYRVQLNVNNEPPVRLTGYTYTLKVSGDVTISVDYIRVVTVRIVDAVGGGGDITFSDSGKICVIDAGSGITYSTSVNPGYILTGFNVNGKFVPIKDMLSMVFDQDTELIAVFMPVADSDMAITDNGWFWWPLIFLLLIAAYYAVLRRASVNDTN